MARVEIADIVSRAELSQASSCRKPCVMRATCPWNTGEHRSPFTGQYSRMDDPSTSAHRAPLKADFGLLYYVARFYDPALGRFSQADTLVPGAGNPLAFDRYAYTFGNPLRYVDPSGHNPECGPDGVYCDHDDWNDFDYDPIELTYGAKQLVEMGRGLGLTLHQLIRIIFEREFNGLMNLKLGEQKSVISSVFTEMLGRNSWDWCEYVYGAHTGAAIVNWVAAHNRVSQSLYDLYTNPTVDKESLVGDSRSYHQNAPFVYGGVVAILNTPDKWKTDAPNAPYTFGHCSATECLLTDPAKFQNTKDTNWNGETYEFSTGETDYYFKWNIFYIITEAQRNNLGG